MSPFVPWLVGSVVLCEVLSLLMLALGTRLVNRRGLRPVADALHRRKIEAADRWPMSRVRRAVEEDDGATATAVLATLILLKSVGSLVLGVIMIFWLPVASLLVPTIAAAHDPEDPELRSWAGRVAVLQVTSHVLAAGVGFALTVVGSVTELGLSDVVSAQGYLIGGVLGASALFAVAAGTVEGRGLVRHRPFERLG